MSYDAVTVTIDCAEAVAAEVTTVEMVAVDVPSSTASQVSRDCAAVEAVYIRVKGDPGPAGPAGASGSTNVRRETLVITADQIAARSAALESAPVPADKTRLSVYGGIDQRFGVDFYIDGLLIRWDGLALETLLAAGDPVSVDYFTGA